MGSLSCARQPARWLARDASLTTRDRSRARLPSPHESTDELAVHGGDRLGIESSAGEKVAHALGRVNSRRLELDVFEPRLCELGAVLGLFEGAGDAADPQLDAASDPGRHVAAHDDIG